MGRSFDSRSDGVYSREDIQGMTTDEIHQGMSNFRRLIREARSCGKDTHDYEVEYCYLDNENQTRSKYEFTSPKVSPRRVRSSEQHSDSNDRQDSPKRHMPYQEQKKRHF